MKKSAVIGISLAVVLALGGLILELNDHPIGNAGTFSLGYFSAGEFSIGVFSAGMFSVGIFSIGIFSVGIFSLSIFNVALYGLGIFIYAWKKRRPKVMVVTTDENGKEMELTNR